MKEINIRKQTEAIKELYRHKRRQYDSMDIKLTNVYLKRINKNIGETVFTKNSLYVLSSTLHEIMQPLGNRNQHNSHNISPEALLEGLCNLQYSNDVSKTYGDRYMIISTTLLDKKVKVVVERNASLSKNKKAKINKLVTLFPIE